MIKVNTILKFKITILSSLFIGLLSSAILGNTTNARNYISFGSEFKMLTERGDFAKNESNNGVEVNFFRAEYRYNQFGILGDASVGFSGPGKTISVAQNHFYNRLYVKGSWYFLKELAFYGAATYADLIEGADNNLQYFAVGNYQSIGLEWNRKKILSIHNRFEYKSGIEIGKKENGNFYSQLTWLKFNHRINDYISWRANVSSGGAAPRGSIHNWHLYTSKINGRLTIRPTKGAGLFVEGSYATVHDDTVTNDFFSQVPYIAAGIDLEGFGLFKR